MAALDIYKETQLVQKMKQRNRPVRAILNGTASIRESIDNKNGDSEPSILEYIKKEEKESKDMYSNRMLRTYITPYLKTAITSAAGQIFKNPIIIKTKDDIALDDRLASVVKNVDLHGSDLNEYLMSDTEESLSYGMSIAYCGFYNPTSTINLSEQISSGAKPFIKLVSYFDILGYNSDNQGNITMLRFQEESSIEDEFLGSDRVTQVRVITPTTYTVYREDEKKNGVIYEQGDIIRFDEKGARITDRVPIEVMYGRKLGTLNAASVFEDMAFINLEHTQVNSDLNWSCHFYLTPFLLTTLGAEAAGADVDITPVLASYLNVTLPSGSEIKWVETNGHAQKAGADQLREIERRMDSSSMNSNATSSTGKETATGRAIDASSKSAKLKMHAEAVETYAKNIIKMLASFMPDVTVPEFEVIANKEFNVSQDNQTIESLSNMEEKRQISLETMLTELKRRGVLSDDIDIQLEVAKIAEETAADGVI